MNWLNSLFHLIYQKRALLPPALATLVALVYGALHLPPPTAAPTGVPQRGSILECRVTRQKIVDGDTVTANCPQYPNLRVRIWGIDAPEMGQRPWGEQSRDAFRQLILGNADEGPLIVEVRDIDRYRRIVGLVRRERGGVDLGLEMVRIGQAIVYEQFNDSAEYRRVQATARAARVGIWATPGDQQNPAAWRRVNARR